jgi:hypothetical protein
MVERVLEKERANFCELFEPGRPAATAGSVPSDDALRKAAEGLFK